MVAGFAEVIEIEEALVAVGSENSGTQFPKILARSGVAGKASSNFR
jgi:hypothetical protein